MPCDSSYLAPNRKELEHRRAGVLLVYVMLQLGQTAEQWMIDEAKNLYARSERTIPALCAALKGMDDDTFERIVYSPRNKTSRDLANWWEDHQEADREREQNEIRAANKQILIEQALRKLTDKERIALGY